MEIILMRHGRPAFTGPVRVALQEYADWHADYEASGIVPDRPPTLPFPAPAAIMTSDLRRAAESARAVCPSLTPAEATDLRELPVPPVRGWLPRRVRLSPHVWSVALRLAWLLGWSGGGESRSAARMRARRAADAIVAEAERSGRVLVVAHGYIILWIARELRRRGWRGPLVPSSRYWACTRYEHR